VHKFLVLGGYGFFGSRICASLAQEPGVRLLLGGRDVAKATATAESLGLDPASALVVDAYGPDLASRLAAAGVNTLIHTAGPFQRQGYTVARAAVEAGCNYIDLGDGRAFVAGIGALNEAAKGRRVTVISGASSVPALSSAVVDRYLPRFATLKSIQLGISSGARAPGLATVQGIFGYIGKPFYRWENGAWAMTHGWMDLRRHRFPAPVGSRWLGSCDIPDLELFPRRYPTVETVTFHAGFASAAGHLVVWGLAGLVRGGVLQTASPFAVPMNRLSRQLEPLVSDKGAMFVTLEGVGHDARPLWITWNLVASRNHGPHIPCGASIALARKIAAGAVLPHGAMPCMGLLTVEEYLAPLHELDIREVVE
jgi:saccharopine dehydrogenase-like NADP-dependent oxidoreductase